MRRYSFLKMLRCYYVIDTRLWGRRSRVRIPIVSLFVFAQSYHIAQKMTLLLTEKNEERGKTIAIATVMSFWAAKSTHCDVSRMESCFGPSDWDLCCRLRNWVWTHDGLPWVSSCREKISGFSKCFSGWTTWGCDACPSSACCWVCTTSCQTQTGYWVSNCDVFSARPGKF